MATETKIEWTDFSSNPIRARKLDGSNRIPGHYCQKISAGCANCYSSWYQPRVGMSRFGGVGPVDPNVEIFLDEKELQRLLRSRKISGKQIFVCDMTDVFGEWVTDGWLDKLFAVFALRPDVTFQVLTKRPELMARYFYGGGLVDGINGRSWRIREAGHAMADVPQDGTINFALPLRNVWLGASCENQAAADERHESMLRLAEVGWLTWVSYEPALGPVDWTGWEFLRWHVTGGESGANARPFDVLWMEEANEFCVRNDIARFNKQMGSNPMLGDVSETHGCPEYGVVDWVNGEIYLGDSHGSDMARWPKHLRVREFPNPNPGDAGRNDE